MGFAFKFSARETAEDIYIVRARVCVRVHVFGVLHNVLVHRKKRSGSGVRYTHYPPPAVQLLFLPTIP